MSSSLQSLFFRNHPLGIYWFYVHPDKLYCSLKKNEIVAKRMNMNMLTG